MAATATLDITTADRELAAAFYPEDRDLADIAAEQVAIFRQEQGRNPRCADKLDAWSNDGQQWAAYLAEHPVIPSQVDPSVAELVAQMRRLPKDRKELDRFIHRDAARLLLSASEAMDVTIGECFLELLHPCGCRLDVVEGQAP
jgi:hypothetical protein